MKIVDPAIMEYLARLYDDGDPVRREMEDLARERGFPIVGPVVGRSLYVHARSIGAKRVFELGSGFGYSALFFSRAVGADGVVHCTEMDEGNVRKARDFLGRAGVLERVTYHQEEAIAALQRVGGVWDIVYNDIDKHDYPQTIELAHAHLRPGGLFITDNVLWSGRVLDGKDDGTETTRGVREFTRRLLSHRGFVPYIDPSRDGVAVALRV